MILYKKLHEYQGQDRKATVVFNPENQRYECHTEELIKGDWFIDFHVMESEYSAQQFADDWTSRQAW